MSTFIAKMIMKEADLGTERGQAKYRAYFTNTAIYVKYQPEVDAILKEKGYSNVIVTE